MDRTRLTLFPFPGPSFGGTPDGPSSQLSRYKWKPRTQPAANAPRLPVDIAGLVAAQEQGDAGDLVGDPAAADWVQLPDLLHRPPRPRLLEQGQRHPRCDQPRTDGVAADGGAGELVACRLHQGDDGGFRGGVVGYKGGGL